MLKFDDGINIDTGGELRILTLCDGVYVVGQGMLIPVKDDREANKIIKDFKK